MTIFVAVPIVAVVGEPVGYPSHATLATPDYIPMQNVHSARPIIRLTTIHGPGNPLGSPYPVPVDHKNPVVLKPVGFQATPYNFHC